MVVAAGSAAVGWRYFLARPGPDPLLKTPPPIRSGVAFGYVQAIGARNMRDSLAKQRETEAGHLQSLIVDKQVELQR